MDYSEGDFLKFMFDYDSGKLKSAISRVIDNASSQEIQGFLKAGINLGAFSKKKGKRLFQYDDYNLRESLSEKFSEMLSDWHELGMVNGVMGQYLYNELWEAFEEFWDSRAFGIAPWLDRMYGIPG